MATGAFHYTEAERDIERANQESIADGFAQFMIARAQVHATLALVAATTEAAFSRGPGDIRVDLVEAMQ